MTAGKSRSRTSFVVVAVAVALFAACSNSDDDPDSAPDGHGTAPETTAASTSAGGDGDNLGSAPVDGEGGPIIDASFSEKACGFIEPQDTEPRCGTITVPSNWLTGEGEITLSVAVFASTADRPADDPVIYLDGGPGSHALDTIQFVDDSILEPLQARGDVVFFDQRGAGRSRPRLDCPELTVLNREIEDSPELDEEAVDERFHTTLTTCRDRLTADGIEIADFNTINNAHDVEAIRVALGYDEWNLYGISYGTRLALEVLRQHPNGVRTAVIDSVFPPQVDPARENPQTFLDSYEAVIAACGREPACAAGGDLGDRFRAVSQTYEAEPRKVEVVDFLTGERDEVYVDGETIAATVRGALYSPARFTDLPELVTELEVGQTEAMSQFLSQDRSNESFFTAGMFYALECNEEVVFADRAAVAAAVPPDPFGLFDTFEYASNTGTKAFETCAAFGSTPAPPISNLAVESDIPTLVMAGRFDPVTPVRWAEAAATGLSNSFVVVAENEAHGISPGECGMGIVVDFLDDPAVEPDSSCLDDLTLRFVGPPDEPVELEAISFELVSDAAMLDIIRPVGWEEGSLIGDSYRQASFLDPTQLIQVAGLPSFADQLAFYLSSTWSVELGSNIGPETIGGHSWQHRTGGTSSVEADWYQTTIDGLVTVVIMLSTLGEADHNRETILMPALESIRVARS